MSGGPSLPSPRALVVGDLERITDSKRMPRRSWHTGARQRWQVGGSTENQFESRRPRHSGEPGPFARGSSTSAVALWRDHLNLALSAPQLVGWTIDVSQPRPNAPTSSFHELLGGRHGESSRRLKSPLSASQNAGSAKRLS